MTTHLGRRAALAAGAALALPPLAARAGGQAAFPSRPVRLMVGVAPGGAPDVAARLLADGLSAGWGQPVVVDNRPAGNGVIAAQAAARAEADGHTLFLAHASVLALNEFLMRNVGYDAERDFAPISLMMITPFLVAARPDLPVTDLAGLARLSRERRDGITFATSSATNLARFAGELLRTTLDINLVNVPYASISGAVQDTIGGRVDLLIDGTPVVTPHVRAGSLKPIAVTSAERFPGLEDVPAVAETSPGFASLGWFGLVAPRAMPAPLAERIAADFRAVAERPAIRDRLLHDFGAATVASSPGDFAAYLRRERQTYRRVAAETGITLD